MDPFWDRILLNNTLKDWLIALVIIAASIVALRLLQFFVIARLRAFTARTKTTLDDFVVRTIQVSVMPLLYILSVYFGLQYLALPAKAFAVIRIAIMVVITFFLLRIVTAFIAYLFRTLLLRDQKDVQREKQSRGILLIVQLVVWLIGILFLIDNLGYDITTLIAGLGIGGIAIALAAQTILGDLFSYFVIFFDKPFETGDFIVVQDKMGTVEYIGIKTTRLRALSGEQLVCSNTDLTNSRVHNFKRMTERRVQFSLGVVYQTPAPTLEQIPAMIRTVIEDLPDTRFDRAHFKTFGASSLDFEAVYFVLSPEYNTFMDVQQRVNLELFRRFEQSGIQFAYPTQMVYVVPTQEEKQARE